VTVFWSRFWRYSTSKNHVILSVRNFVSVSYHVSEHTPFFYTLQSSQSVKLLPFLFVVRCHSCPIV